MSNNVIVHDKKRALLAHREKILEDIKYYEKRIEDFSTKKKAIYFADTDSADSDDDFPISIDTGPSVIQLKLQQSMLRTCLQATQELTNLHVLQSEINIMVEDPVMDKEPLVKEQGTWREVTAECRLDLIPFSITFYIHQPNRMFSQTSYRGLRVIPVKSAHEAELAKSVLPGLTRPSDAVEVLRSYAAAYRSRRTTLAELVDRFANNLFMEAIAEGGYVLKCANLLEVSWWLENKWSPVAAFHHRLSFEIEYMDETYLQIITQAYKELSDPSIDTNERTQLLSKIISTCVEAQGPTQELYESMESDPESIRRLKKRRTTLDEQPEALVTKKHKDSEVMAPPKSLPKKTKPKGKENENDNRKSDSKAGKRVNTDNNEAVGVKKAKTSHKLTVDESVNVINKDTINRNSAKVTVINSNNAVTAANKPKKTASLPTSGKKVETSTTITNKDLEQNKAKKSSKELIETDRTNAIRTDVQKTPRDSVTCLNKAVNNVANGKGVEKSKKSSSEPNKNQVNANSNIDMQTTNKDSIDKTKKSIASLNKVANKKVAASKNSQVESGMNGGKKPANEASEGNKTKNVGSAKNSLTGSGKTDENIGNKGTIISKKSNAKNQTDLRESVDSTMKVTKALQKTKTIASSKKIQNFDDTKSKNAAVKIFQEQQKNPNSDTNKKFVEKKNSGHNIVKGNTVEKMSKVNNVATVKNKCVVAAIVEKTKNITKANEINGPQKEVQAEEDLNNKNINKKVESASKNKIVIKNLSHKNPSAKNKLPPIQNKPKISSGNTENKLNANSAEKERQKVSKIPQKKFSPISESVLKKNPLRISPRKFPSKFKSPLESRNQKVVQKIVTNIPRLMKRPTSKNMQT